MQLIQIFDNTILDFIQSHMTSPFMDTVMPLVTRLGDNGYIWVLWGIILACIPKCRKYGFAVLCTLIISSIIGNIVLKPLIERARPFSGDPLHILLIMPPTDFSFPSGHTVASFASAAMLWKINRKLGIPAFIIASLIAFSRMYLFVHYPTDVIAGIVLGVSCSVITYHFIFKRPLKKNVS